MKNRYKLSTIPKGYIEDIRLIFVCLYIIERKLHGGLKT